MLILSNFTYHCPSTAAEALELLNDSSVIIAGGSDLVPQLKTGVCTPSSLVDLSGIEEFKQVVEKEDGIYIGSMATLSHLAKHKLVLEKLPAVSQAARNVASPQIRNRATIGGNILQARRCFYYNQTKEWRQGIPRCYKVGGDTCIQIQNSQVCRALYYSDIAPVLLAYNAKVSLYLDGKEKLLTCKELLDAHCKDINEKVLLKEIFIPKHSYNGVFSKFTKYSLRGSIDFPIINFACVSSPDFLKIFVGAINTHVVELTETEGYLKEKGNHFAETEALEIALQEMKEKSQIIRESGISVQVKRNAFRYIEALLAEVKSHIQ